MSGTIRGGDPGAAEAVEFRGVGKDFGPVTAVEELTLHIRPGEFVSLLGPSGCGKTTTLRMVAGFLQPTHGTIWIEGECVNGLPAYARNCGMVFQNYALFPHLSAHENVAYGLRLRRVPRREIVRRVGEALEMVRMGAWHDRFPRQLSGGQQQRVALARALVIRPKVLLLDEPLSNLDARLRLEMRDEIRSVVTAVGITTIFVTHDQEESLTMADRIVVMNQGRVEQVGSAMDLYERPQTAFVATFIGITNLLRDLEVLQGLDPSHCALKTKTGLLLEAQAMPSLASGSQGDGVALSIRPERIRIEPASTSRPPDWRGAPNRLLGTVVSRTYHGPIIRYRVAVEGTEFLIDQQNREVSPLNVGDGAALWWMADDARIVVA